jgi:hypothetical protein
MKLKNKKNKKDQSQLSPTIKTCDTIHEAGSHYKWQARNNNNVKFTTNQNN